MKSIMKLMVAFLFVYSHSIIAQTNEDYVMFLSLYLDPAPGKAVELVKGAKVHNQKFHAEGESKAYLWSIMSGPRSGQFVWVQGPVHYVTFDTDLTEEHNMDWEKNVASNCRKVHTIQMWRRSDTHSYNPDNEIVGDKVIARVFKLKSHSGAQEAVMDVILKIKEVCEAKNYNLARRVYTQEFRSETGENVSLIYPFESFTELETRRGLPPSFLEDYEAVHGQGSTAAFQEILDSNTNGWYDEVRIPVK